MRSERFDPALVARYAMNNALGFSLLTMAYLKDRDLPVADWASWLGHAFAGPGTNWVPGMSARRMAEEAALEIASCGGRVAAVSGDDDSAEATVEWPPEADLEETGLGRADVEPFWTIWEPIASSVGLHIAHVTRGRETTLSFAR